MNDKHDRPYKCHDPYCKYYELGFPNRHELGRHHRRKAHNFIREDDVVHVCPMCGKMDPRADNFKAHLETVHNDNAPEVTTKQYVHQ